MTNSHMPEQRQLARPSLKITIWPKKIQRLELEVERLKRRYSIVILGADEMPRQTLYDKVRGWVHSLDVQVVEIQSKRKVVTVAVVTKDEVDKPVQRRRLAKEWLG